jgi:hypothetical protein
VTAAGACAHPDTRHLVAARWHVQEAVRALRAVRTPLHGFDRIVGCLDAAGRMLDTASRVLATKLREPTRERP